MVCVCVVVGGGGGGGAGGGGEEGGGGGGGGGRYTLPVVQKGQQVTHTVGFSSSPSWLSSIDDWYVTEGTSALAVTETSHSIRNGELYKKLTPKTVSCWIRSVVANTLATDGASWGELFGYMHSGTYNNEWQVIDTAKFTPGVRPAAGGGLLTIVEEVPGMVHSEDMSATLADDAFWPSFNVPFFPDIQHAAGYSKSDWSTDPRHCLFTALQASVLNDTASAN